MSRLQARTQLPRLARLTDTSGDAFGAIIIAYKNLVRARAG